MKKLISLLLVLMAALPMLSQNIIHPKIAGPNGLWVNSYNGVLFFAQTDMETHNSAMPMQLTFYYNSSAKKTDYGYGLGFSLGYEMRYQVEEGGDVTIETGDGRTDTYKRFGDMFEAPAGVFSTLTQEDGIYVLTQKTGERYEFADATHSKLTAIVDRHGNRTQLAYQNGLLTEIKDAVGHTINLTYSDGLLVSASSTFHKGSISYGYDSKRRLVRRTDAMGNITLYDYDKRDYLDEITDANGNKTNITYNASGLVSRLKTAVSDKSIRYDGDKTVFVDYTEPKNIYSYYRWDEKGRVIEKAGMCCGTQSKMEYDEDDNVIKHTDANGHATTYTYDDRGNMLSMTDALGHTERYTYDEMYNNVTSYQDKNGNLYRFDYNGKGDLTSLSGPEGFSNAFTYNEQGWPITITDANGNVTTTSYNPDGTTLQIMDAAGYTRSFAYDISGNIITFTDAKNQQTSYTYDNNNRIVSQTDALGNTTTLSYDKVGNVVRIKDAKNQITAFTYDALGHVLTQTDKMGGISRFTYDGMGNVLTVTDPFGHVQTMTYNERNKLLTQTNAANETTSFDYDAKGNLVAVFQPNGNIINCDHDILDRIDQLSDNLGLIAHYTYDNNGNRLTVTDGLDRTVTYSYDALNRLKSELLPSGARTTYTYDNNSNLLSVTNGNGKGKNYTYSSLNQQLTHTDALHAQTQFEYDANGNLIKAIDANGNATSYSYDALNRNTAITFANGLSLQYSFNELDQVIECKDRAGNLFHYDYDAMGRLLSKTYPDGTQDKYTYDAIGQMLTAINKDATVTFTYDQVGRILSETLNGKVTSYGYDVAAGKRTLTYPSGMNVVELLNDRNQIAAIFQNGEEVVTIEYNVSGQKTAQTYANGITSNYSYNDNGWLSQIVDDKQVMNLQMDYDAIGNIIKRRDIINEERTETYGYDAISQLISFKRGSSVDNSYQFDLLGNRIKVLENGVATNYVCNNVNAYTSITGGLNFTPQYDGNGNLLNDDKHTYTYDLNNKQVGIDENDVVIKYDALGRRITKNATSYYYVGDQMVEEYIDGQLSASYLFGNDIDETFQMTKNNVVYYFHTNHIGSAMAVSDAEGRIVERVDYDAYGLPTFYDANGNIMENTLVGNAILFTGREYDVESGTYYYRARSMQPQIGRFTQHDPLMYVDGMNDYSYVGNMPIEAVDLWGLFLIEIVDCNIDASKDKKNPTLDDLYNAQVVVTDNNGKKYKFAGSTFPDSGSSPIKQGEYIYTNRYGHKGKNGRIPGLNLGEIINGEFDRGIGWLPTANRKRMINVHKGRKYGYKRGSDGCITIHPDQWESFSSLFFNNETAVDSNNNNTTIDRTNEINGKFYEINAGIIRIKRIDCDKDKQCDIEPIKGQSKPKVLYRK